MKLRLPLMIAAAFGSSLLLSSCNTFLGMGRDFQRLGQGLENTAYGKKW
jgi:predicted small secreted protein